MTPDHRQTPLPSWGEILKTLPAALVMLLWRLMLFPFIWVFDFAISYFWLQPKQRRLQREIERLREEMRIKDAILAQVDKEERERREAQQSRKPRRSQRRTGDHS